MKESLCVYLFEGTAENVMQCMLDALDRAAVAGPARSAHFHSALVALVGLYERSVRAGAPSPERLRHFREQSASALVAFADLLATVASEARNMAESANDKEWPELCVRRSAIQTLLDDYSGFDTLIDLQDVAELDEEMRRVGEDQGPVRGAALLPGMPASHWWWRYPSQKALAASGVRVLDPAMAFATLHERATLAGWRRVDLATADEPLSASFERSAHERFAYSFDPALGLRMVRGSAVAAADGRDLLAAVSSEQILDWLRGPAEATILRGIAASLEAPDRDLLCRLEILRHDGRANIAKEAGNVADAIREAVERIRM